jgi:CSLREA domain-containing protein
MKDSKAFCLFPCLIVAFIVLFTSIVSSHAATINATATAPDILNGADGKCSLREAITNINNGATTYADCVPTGAYGANDAINIPAGTYTIAIPGDDEDLNATGDFDINKSVAIAGAGAETTIIDAKGIDRVLDIDTTQASGVDVSISGATITGGVSDSWRGGGGIYNNGMLTVTNCTISGNTEIDDNDGGGIFNNGTLTVTNATISGNDETDAAGGGIYNNGTATLTNTTISGNKASSGGNGGGGIFNDGTLTVTNSTISGNTVGTAGSGGGISHQGGTVTLLNTIVASNTGGNCAAAIGAGTIGNGGNNIDDGTTCGWDSEKGSMSSTNPQLEALALNSPGTTQTHALKAGSPAIDGVTYNAPNSAPSTDQRGVPRPQGDRYDIGAYEYAQQPPPPAHVQAPALTEGGMIILALLIWAGSIY